MASSSDNETNINPTQVDSSDQLDDLNQNQNQNSSQNTELQNPGLNCNATNFHNIILWKFGLPLIIMSGL